MALNKSTTTTEVAAILEQEWSPEMPMAANEERVVTRNFSAPMGVSKIGNTLNISIVGLQTINSLAGTADSDGVNLTYNQITETSVAVTPSRIYAAVQPNRSVETRLLRFPAWKTAVKSQLVSSLATQIDVDGAALATALTQVVGNGGVDISKTLLTAGIAALAAGAKERWSPMNNKLAYLCVYTNQIDDVLNTNEFTNAQIRGNGASAAVSGWVWQSFGITLAESGNVKTAGGIAYNMLYVPEAFVLGYNEEPNVYPDQVSGLATRIIATAEYGVKTVFNAYAVAVQTKDT